MKLPKFAFTLPLALMLAVLMDIPVFALGDDTNVEQEAQPLTACTLEELQAAIESVSDSDTIYLMDLIHIDTDCTIGTDDKTIILKRDKSSPSLQLIDIGGTGESKILFQNIIFDNDFPLQKVHIGQM